MSISGAFNVSRSALAATEAWADVTSGNIANASRAGYARRSTMLSTTGGAGGGFVTVSGIRREADESLARMHRDELGRLASQQTTADTLETYSIRLGQPGDPQSPATALADLQSAFDMLANAPNTGGAQQGALDAAEAMARVLNNASAGLSDAAEDNLRAIGSDVSRMNEMLYRVADYNRQIVAEPGATVRRAALEDDMSRALDEMAATMDLQVRTGSDGQVAVYAGGGAALVEGARVTEVSFARGTGTLKAGEVDITPGRTGVRGISEGSLAARIRMNGETLPRMQDQLDQVAAALVKGFEAADSTTVDGRGLFTDGGNAFGSVAGLAARISINERVQPENGGAVWRMRDGMGAATEGAASQTDQVDAFSRVLSQPDADGSHAYDPAAGLGTGLPLGQYLSALISDQQQQRVGALDRVDSLTASTQALESARAGVEGVNLDDELQQLTMIEQAYNANAQMMKALSDMMDTLLNAV